MTGECLQMCKKSLRASEMSDVAYVDQAAGWSKDLTRMRTRGPGDLENAMRAIERDYGIDYWTLWTLRYRRGQFKDIGVGIYMRLRAAYEAECARQMRRLRHDIEVTKQVAGPDHPVVAESEAVLREAWNDQIE